VAGRTSAQPSEPLPARVRASALAALGPRLLAKVDAGRYLGVSPRTVEAFVAAGRLQAVKLLGRKALYDVQDLDQLVDQVKASQ
jgi:excisionase family DNA binding protein